MQMVAMTTIDSVHSRVLDLPPSCIAFSPSSTSHFVVGTYLLHPKSQKLEDDPSPASETQADKDGSVVGIVSPGDGVQSVVEDVTGSSDELALQKRTGSLILFHLDGETINKQHEIMTDYAILDIQWAPIATQHGKLLAVATSTGLLVLYQLLGKGSAARLHEVSVHRVADASVLALSLTWHPSDRHVIGVTFSDGRVSLCVLDGRVDVHSLQPMEGNSPTANKAAMTSSQSDIETTQVQQHELEAWCMAFSEPTDTSASSATVVLSGGDDMVLQCSRYDVAIQSDSPSFEPQFCWQDRRSHGAGVTAILPLSPTLAVTGSYDDHIRLLTTPTVGRRQILASLDLGGGVWRIKILHGDPAALLADAKVASVDGSTEAAEQRSSSDLILLVSCMHAGTRIVRLTHGPESEEWCFRVEGKFEEHRSMNYGSDVWPDPAGAPTKTVVSTSFYDKLLCLWKWDARGVTV